jgi:hypothetical protein
MVMVCFSEIIERKQRYRAWPNKQLQWTVMDKVPRHMWQRAAAELRR